MRIDPTLLLNSMDDDHFKRVKMLFVEYQETFSHTKRIHLVEFLTETICKWNIVERMDREEFGELVLCYFYNELSDHTYAVHFMENLRSYLTERCGRHQVVQRAKRYFTHLDKMIAQTKELNRKKAEETVEAKQELIETLLDFLMISLRLLEAITAVPENSKDPIDNISDEVSSQTYRVLSRYHFRYGKDNQRTKNDLTNEEKWFRYFLTEMLIVRLRQDHGDLPEEAVQ